MSNDTRVLELTHEEIEQITKALRLAELFIIKEGTNHQVTRLLPDKDLQIQLVKIAETYGKLAEDIDYGEKDV